MNPNNLLICLIIFTNLIVGENRLFTNTDLLNLLNNDSNWNKLEYTDDNITISKKELSFSKLVAIKVEKILNINPQLITDLLMDIDKYNTFVSNPKSFHSELIKSSSKGLIGYQFIKIDFPFFNNREYFFEIIPEGIIKDESNILCHWYLLNSNKIIELNKKRMPNATYLAFGAGIWKAEPYTSMGYKVSYSLYMDPGGSIPDFLIDLINKQSIIGLFRDVEREVISKNRNY